MALNLSNLKKADNELKSRGGSDLYLTNKDIGEETFFRIAPPTPEMNGVYYFEQTVYWIGKKPFVCPSTFNLPSVIEERIESMKEEATKEGDKELQELIDNINKTSSFLVPGFHLNYKFDGNDEFTGFEVVTGKARVLQTGSMLLKAVNSIVLSPKMSRRYKKIDDGITDRVEGCNIVLSKTGKGLKTEYSAFEDEVMEIDAKYYEKLPSVIGLSKAQCYTDDYLNAILDQYFDGAAKPEDSEKVSRYKDELDSKKAPKDEPKEEKVKPTRKRRSAAKKKEVEEIEVVEEEVVETEEAVEEAPKPKRRSRRKAKQEDSDEAPKKAAEKSVLDDLEDLDD